MKTKIKRISRTKHASLLNSKSKYIECIKCGKDVKVDSEAISAKCSTCVAKMVPFGNAEKEIKSERPKGWALLAVFVDKDGNVFYKGKEQVELKGTLPKTVIVKKPKKVKDKKQIELNKEKKQEKLVKEYNKKKKLKKLQAKGKK